MSVCKEGSSVLRLCLRVSDLMRHKGSGDSEALPKCRREREPGGAGAPAQASHSQTRLRVCSEPPASAG